eukprot:scaffold92425_cov57-Phaeocystis_antarctica.AAC.1
MSCGATYFIFDCRHVFASPPKTFGRDLAATDVGCVARQEWLMIFLLGIRARRQSALDCGNASRDGRELAGRDRDRLWVCSALEHGARVLLTTRADIRIRRRQQRAHRSLRTVYVLAYAQAEPRRPNPGAGPSPGTIAAEERELEIKRELEMEMEMGTDD